MTCWCVGTSLTFPELWLVSPPCDTVFGRVMSPEPEPAASTLTETFTLQENHFLLFLVWSFSADRSDFGSVHVSM